MKRIIGAIFTIVLLSVRMTAYADVVWTPFDDDFFNANYEDFVCCDEDCYVNSPEGSAAYYDRPNGTVQGYLENGEKFCAYYQYIDENDVQWGYSTNERYVKMEDLLSVYDREFFQDHADEIIGSLKETPENADEWVAKLQKQVKSAQTESGYLLYLTWNYPHGLAYVQGTLSADDAREMVDNCYRFYVDADNRVWGYLFYYYGTKDRWVCLTDICNPDLAEAELYTGDIYFEEHGIVKTEIDEEWQKYLPTSDSLSDLASESKVNSETDEVNEADILNSQFFYIAFPVVLAIFAGILLFFWPGKNLQI